MKIRMIFASTVLLAAVSASAEPPQLKDPMAVRVDGAPLDVERLGHAAPFFGDFDGDGLRDLLVGEFYEGRLQIYRNMGESGQPKFSRYTLFQDGASGGRIFASCCMGFGPQLVDFDGDGDDDIISGDWIGQVIVFEKLADGSYQAGEAVKGRDGDPVEVGYGVYAHAVDWDNDGDMDLLAGTVDSGKEGSVRLLINQGTPDAPAFDAPKIVAMGGEPLVVPKAHAAPVVADWDGDGQFDLVVGCGDGSVLWCRNVGDEAGTPRFAPPQTLVAAPAKEDNRGTCAKVCVTDWNEDGCPDLLLGDVGEPFEKVLDEDELALLGHARDRQREILQAWAESFQRYRRLVREQSGEDTTDKDVSQRLTEAREQLVTWKRLRNRFYHREKSLQPSTQYHGRVWLLLGQRQ